MNYIGKLLTENQILKDGFADLLSYVQSSKFQKEPMVNSGDIVLRICEIREKLFQETGGNLSSK